MRAVRALKGHNSYCSASATALVGRKRGAEGREDSFLGKKNPCLVSLITINCQLHCYHLKITSHSNIYPLGAKMEVAAQQYAYLSLSINL